MHIFVFKKIGYNFRITYIKCTYNMNDNDICIGWNSRPSADTLHQSQAGESGTDTKILLPVSF